MLGIKAYITPLNILYTIAVLLCLSFSLEMALYIINFKKLKGWKPDMAKMHYVIRTATETCVPHFFHDVDNDIYTVEYREMLSGRLIVKRIISAEQYLKSAKMQSVEIQVSTLRIYIVTPNQHVLYRDYTRTDREDNFVPFTQKDITQNILRISAEYFRRNCPEKKNKSIKRESDIKYVEGLPLALRHK